MPKKRVAWRVAVTLLSLAAFAVAVSVLTDYYRDHYRENFAGAGYGVTEVPDFLTSAECDALVRAARAKGLETSLLFKSDSNVIDTGVRVSEQTWLLDTDAAVVADVSKRVEKLSGMPSENQEALQVVHYGVGGKYEPHFDACDTRSTDTPSCERMNGRGAGPRLRTVLLYLSDVAGGGGTTFPRIGTTIRPQKGKAVVFDNVDSETHVILDKSFHGGDPVTEGEKWVANKWIHARKWS